MRLELSHGDRVRRAPREMNQAKGDEKKSRKEDSGAPDILQPLPRAQTDQVQKDRDGETGEGERQNVGPIITQSAVAASDDKGSRHRSRKEQCGIIENVVDPITPAADESVAFTKLPFRPRVDPSFIRKCRRELD